MAGMFTRSRMKEWGEVKNIPVDWKWCMRSRSAILRQSEENHVNEKKKRWKHLSRQDRPYSKLSHNWGGLKALDGSHEPCTQWRNGKQATCATRLKKIFLRLTFLCYGTCSKCKKVSGKLINIRIVRVCTHCWKEMLKVLECISNHYTKLVCSKKRGSHAYE